MCATERLTAGRQLLTRFDPFEMVNYSKVFSYSLDACLIVGVLVSGIYLARNSAANEPAAAAAEEVIFTGAPPLGETPSGRLCRGNNLNPFEIVVDLSFSRGVPAQPINPSEAEDIGDRLLDLFVQVRSS